MGSWPFTRLHFGHYCIAIAGPHIQVLDASSGVLLWKQRCSSTVACSAVDNTYTWLVTTGEDKRLNVWSVHGLKLQSSRELPKKATVVRLSPDAQSILVADKFGDVFSYPRIPTPDTTVPDTTKKREATAAHATPHGSLILGHASIVTALLLSHDGHYIVTADRDEHIRVSRYPHGYIIERYCLGHRLFVSALCLPSFEHSTLVSGGGDSALYFWDWMTGTLRCQIPIMEAIRPFLRVQLDKPRWHRANEGVRKGHGRRKKRRKHSDDQLDAPDLSTPDQDVAMDRVEIAEPPSLTESHFVFALAKIVAIDVNGDRNVVFSAFGASALFYCSYPYGPNDVPPVRHVELVRPVLDFVVINHTYGHVLVSIDTGWTSYGSNDGYNPAVTLLSWQDGALKVYGDVSPFVDTLNGIHLDASQAELAALELYAPLSLLPKNADGGEEGEHDVNSRPSTPILQGKVAGLLKTKQEISRMREKEEQQGVEEEPEPKKIKV